MEVLYLIRIHITAISTIITGSTLFGLEKVEYNNLQRRERRINLRRPVEKQQTF
jgi:hypothetical protein